MTPGLLLVAGGCSGIPSSIPRTPGTIDELVLPDLLSAATPDLPYLLLASVQQLAVEDFRECPSIETFGGISVRAATCTDSAHIDWDGSALYTESDTLRSFTFNDLKASGFAGGWSANGSIEIAPYALNLGGYEMRTKLALNSLDGSELQMWIDTTGAVTYHQDSNRDDDAELSGYYVDTYTGTIGLEAWGLAEVEALRLPFAQSIGCGYGSAGAGGLRLTGTNEAQLYFLREGGLLADAGAPRRTADTGLADTGFIDTAVDTDAEGPSGFDFGGSANTDLCGTCTSALIDGHVLPECLLVNRTLAFPFVAPW